MTVLRVYVLCDIVTHFRSDVKRTTLTDHFFPVGSGSGGSGEGVIP